MVLSKQQLFFGILAVLACFSVAAAQPPQVGQAPPKFQLNAIQQAQLDLVLDLWERESSKVATFKCPFERWEYNAAFGPGPDVPLSKDQGELSFARPDKGSFQITAINKWQAQPISPGQQPGAQAQGTWVLDSSALGEHWVCDGSAVYEYRHDQKQLVVRQIPAEMQGQGIADGPLPFLFGAKADKLKQRYWLRVVEQPNANEIWLQALPKYQTDAANYRGVEVNLDRARMLPTAMRVHLPDGSRHVYMFVLTSASVNNPLARLQAMFQAPRTPYGWKRVVEAMPVADAGGQESQIR